MAPLLEIKGLTKRYRKLVAVDGLDLQIHPGEFVGFIGPNGAGKSTLIKTLGGVHRPDAGKIRWFFRHLITMVALDKGAGICYLPP